MFESIPLLDNDKENLRAEARRKKIVISSLIPESDDVNLYKAIKSKKISLCLYKMLLISKEKFNEINPKFLEKIYTLSKGDLKTYFNDKVFNIKFMYSDFGFGVSKYSINSFLLLLREYNLIVSEFTENIQEENMNIKKKRKFISLNQKIYVLDVINFYIKFNSYIYYLYNLLYQDFLINKDYKIEKERDKIIEHIRSHTDSSVEEAIQKIHTNENSLCNSLATHQKKKKFSKTKEKELSTDESLSLNKNSESKPVKKPRIRKKINNDLLMSTTDKDDDNEEYDF